MSNTPPDTLSPSPAPAPEPNPRQHVPQGGQGAAIPDRRLPLRRIVAVLAAALALFSLGTLAAVLILYLQDRAVQPWLIGASFYALPIAFVLMGGLVIDSIRRRRRG